MENRENFRAHVQKEIADSAIAIEIVRVVMFVIRLMEKSAAKRLIERLDSETEKWWNENP